MLVSGWSGSVLLAACCLVPAVTDDLPHLPLDEIVAGQRGEVHTVLAGRRQETIPLEILGIAPGGNYLFTRRANGAFSRERFEAHLIGCTDTARAIGARKLEHHRLEGAALAAMDGNHFAGARRRETDTWRLFVFQ